MDAIHRGRGGGSRDTLEQVENRRLTLSLYPQGWREREAGSLGEGEITMKKKEGESEDVVGVKKKN